MTNRIYKFLHLAPRYKLVLGQAWLLLGWYRLVIILVPFKRIIARLQHHAITTPPPALPLAQQEEAVIVGRLVSAAARLTPWQSLCLVQVLVTQRLLAKRNIPGRFYLGVRRACETSDGFTGLSAHAWLQSGDVIVNGAAGHEYFTVVSNFSWDERRLGLYSAAETTKEGS